MTKLIPALLMLAATTSAWGDGTPQATPTPANSSSEANGDKSLEEFRAAAERLERAVTHAAQENTKGLGQKINKSMNSVLSDMSKALNQAAESLEKKSKKSTTGSSSSSSGS